MKQDNKYWFLEERLVLGLVAILSLTGLFTWFNISEQEDPFFPYRNGLVSISVPGMSASAIEDTIVQPFERSLATVDEVNSVTAESSDGVASISIELRETISDTEQAWQRVREKVDSAKSQHSNLATEFRLDDRAQDTAGILLTIETSRSFLEARRYALFVRDELYKLSAIRQVSVVGDPGEQIEIFYPQELMLEMDISVQEIARKVSDANALKNIGLLKGDLYQNNIAPITRLDSMEALEQVEIQTSDQKVIKLSEFTQIRTTTNPIEVESFWVNGKQRIGISIVVPPNKIRVTDFGEELLSALEKLNKDTQDFKIDTVFFQPEWTEKRRNGLALSLFYSSIGVGIVLFLLMSPKLALVVSLTIPAIALSSIALFGMSGGVLQQISIAGLVISLGLMVDNSIVMSELISRNRQLGLGKLAASRQAIKELHKPLATSTFTTIAAFVPMLLSEGGVADFVRMIPIIVIIAIIISYVYSLTLLPTITNNLKTFDAGRASGIYTKLGGALGQLGTKYPKSVILFFVVLVVLSLIIPTGQGGEFFPKSGRNQAFIDIEGSSGLSHAATLLTVKRVESILKETDEVTKIVSFVGNSGPRFYYNLSESPNEPNIARVVFETSSNKLVTGIVSELNKRFEERFKSTRVRAKEIGQGPPVESPIEVRVLGDDRRQLLAASEDVFELVNSHWATIDTRRDYVLGKPKLEFVIDEFNLQKAGISRVDLSDLIAWRTTGIDVTEIPTERDSVRVVMRDHQNIEISDANYIMNTIVMNDKGEKFPLSLFARQKFEGEAPVLTRRNGFNANIVKADIVAHADEGNILEEIMPELKAISSRYRTTLEFGGVAEEEGDSNGALLKTLPVGVIMLFGALILQFNSFRVAGLIMLTIPLAMIGVGPTLSMVGVTFGFMSMLGLLALTGIVVNTAIILIDKVIVKIRDENTPLLQAIEQSTEERFKPVILTTCTTIIGMIPLTSPESPLWPPLAWTIIGGLITSTILTLIVLPALLSLILNESKVRGVDQ